MSPHQVMLLTIAAVLGTILGLLGLVLAAICARKLRASVADFRMMESANGRLIARNDKLLEEIMVLNRIKESYLETAPIANQLIEARQRITELERNNLELADARSEAVLVNDEWLSGDFDGVVPQEIDDDADSVVITSAQSPRPTRTLN